MYLLFSDCPSKRWSHAMCLSDPETAILIGGEAEDQASCKDSIWKLEIGAYHFKIQYEKLKNCYLQFPPWFGQLVFVNVAWMQYYKLHKHIQANI